MTFSSLPATSNDTRLTLRQYSKRIALPIIALSMIVSLIFLCIGYFEYLFLLERKGGAIHSNLIWASLAYPVILAGVAQYLFAVAVIPLLFSIPALVFGLFYRDRPKVALQMSFLIWYLIWWAIYFTSNALYPHSKFSRLDPSLAGLLAAIAVVLLIIIFTWKLYQQWKLKGIVAPFIMITILYVLIWIPDHNIDTHATAITNSPRQQPDIIVIGVDSLRYDLLANQNSPIANIPELRKIYTSSYQFDNVFATLARTYISWLSMLSGQYPTEMGVRMNLSEKEPPYPDLLPNVLKHKGYKTILGLDERRFANFSAKHGFDEIIGPRQGALDFLFAGIDLPYLNLLNGSPLYKWLLPYSDLNRAAYSIYSPERFNRSLIDAVGETDAETPLFLLAHYCLPHWPYYWPGTPDPNAASIPAYLASIEKVDSLIKNLKAYLQQAGRLHNAILWVVSDHGEGFPSPPGSEYKNHSLREAPSLLGLYGGHGTNLLSESQSRLVFAVQRFEEGQPVILPESNKTVFSNIIFKDITLKLADALDIEQALPDKAPAFMETGFTVDAILSEVISPQKVFQETADMYRVNRKGMLVVRTDKEEEIMQQKSFGVAEQSHIYSYNPKENCFSYIDRKTSQQKICDGELGLNQQRALTQIKRHFALENLNEPTKAAAAQP